MGGERERHNPLAHSHTHSHTHGHMSSPSLWVSIRGKRLGLVTPSHSEAFSSSPPSTLKEEVEDVDDELDESEESAENDESHDESEEESQSQSQTHNERGSNSNERREESLTQELSEFVANPASTKGKMSTTEQTNRHTRSQIIDGFQDEVMLNNFVQEERKKNMSPPKHKHVDVDVDVNVDVDVDVEDIPPPSLPEGFSMTPLSLRSKDHEDNNNDNDMIIGDNDDDDDDDEEDEVYASPAKPQALNFLLPPEREYDAHDQSENVGGDDRRRSGNEDGRRNPFDSPFRQNYERDLRKMEDDGCRSFVRVSSSTGEEAMKDPMPMNSTDERGDRDNRNRNHKHNYHNMDMDIDIDIDDDNDSDRSDRERRMRLEDDVAADRLALPILRPNNNGPHEHRHEHEGEREHEHEVAPTPNANANANATSISVSDEDLKPSDLKAKAPVPFWNFESAVMGDSSLLKESSVLASAEDYNEIVRPSVSVPVSSSSSSALSSSMRTTPHRRRKRTSPKAKDKDKDKERRSVQEEGASARSFPASHHPASVHDHESWNVNVNVSRMSQTASTRKDPPSFVPSVSPSESPPKRKDPPPMTQEPQSQSQVEAQVEAQVDQSVARVTATGAIHMNLVASDLLKRGKNEEAMTIYHSALKVAKEDLMEANKLIANALMSGRVESHGRTRSHTPQQQQQHHLQQQHLQQQQHHLQQDYRMQHTTSLSSAVTQRTNNISSHRQRRRSDDEVEDDDDDDDDLALTLTHLHARRMAIAGTIANTLNNLGVVCEMVDDYDAALVHCREALRVYREMCHGGSPSSSSSLGGSRGSQGCSQPNATLAKTNADVERTIRNVALMERGRESYARRMTLHATAEEFLAVGNLAEALPIYQKARAVEVEWLGSSHPTSARTLQTMGNVKYLLSTATTTDDQDGHGHGHGHHHNNHLRGTGTGTGKGTGTGITTTTETMWRDRQKSEAVADLKSAAASLEATLGPLHPYVASALLDLAAVSEREEALDYYKRALVAQRAIYGDPDANDLGGTGTGADGTKRDRVTPPLHPDLATTLNNMGVLYFQKGLFEPALQCYREACEVYQSLQQMTTTTTTTTSTTSSQPYTGRKPWYNHPHPNNHHHQHHVHHHQYHQHHRGEDSNDGPDDRIWTNDGTATATYTQELAMVYSNLGELHVQRRDWDAAQEALEQSLCLVGGQTAALLSLGEVCLRLDNPEKALRVYRRAYRAQCDEMTDHNDEHDHDHYHDHPKEHSKTPLSPTLPSPPPSHRQQQQQQQQQYQQQYQQRHQGDLDRADTLETMGDIQGDRLGRPQAGLDCCAVALRILRRSLGESHLRCARCLRKMGLWHSRLHCHDEAVTCLQEALRLFRKHHVPDRHPMVVTARRKCAASQLLLSHSRIGAAVAREDWTAALQAYRYQLQYAYDDDGARAIPRRNARAELLRGMARVHAARDEPDEALILHQEILRSFREEEMGTTGTHTGAGAGGAGGAGLTEEGINPGGGFADPYLMARVEADVRTLPFYDPALL